MGRCPERQERRRDVAALTRRFAESRLRAELQRNGERELERRAIVHGPAAPSHRRKSVDVLPSEMPAAYKHHSASAAARRTSDHFERRPELDRHGEIDVEQSASVQAAGVSLKPSAIDREVPSVRRMYEYPPSYPGDVDDTLVGTSTRRSPQTRIEREIAEYRERENELRFVES